MVVEVNSVSIPGIGLARGQDAIFKSLQKGEIGVIVFNILYFIYFFGGGNANILFFF